MNFNTNLPEWKNEGTEPSNELKNNGFQSGYKPPAGVFNWFWSLVTKAIKELQSKLENDISMEGNKITNVGEPVLRSDVATRGFVEDFSIEGSTYVAVDENNDGNIVLRPYVPLVDDPVDEVVEQGGSGNWTYRKWESGIAECWFRGAVEFPTDTVGSGIDGLYVVSGNIDLPVEFKSKPLSICDTDWNATNWVQSGADTTYVSIRKFANQNGINARTNTVSIYVKGTWK